MKKAISIILFIPLIVISVYAVIVNLCPENKDFYVVLENIVIEDLSDTDIENLIYYGEFYSHSVKNEITSTVTSDAKKFKKISLKFLLCNSSKKIVMEDISITHNFIPELEKRVVTYNDKNGDITFFLFPRGHINYPQHQAIFEQKILVDCTGINNKEIKDLFMEGNCEVTYFTGPFTVTDGQKTSGFGKHTKYYEFDK